MSTASKDRSINFFAKLAKSFGTGQFRKSWRLPRKGAIQMALTFELCEPTALAEGGNFIYVSIKKKPKLALSAHKVSAIGLTPFG